MFHMGNNNFSGYSPPEIGWTNSDTITITTPADQAKIRRKVDGTWVKGKAYFKEEGAWVKAKKIYKKIDGVWYINTNYDS